MWKLTAMVRKLGSIGIFYEREFEIESAMSSTFSDLIGAFNVQHGCEWELLRIEREKPIHWKHIISAC